MNHVRRGVAAVASAVLLAVPVNAFAAETGADVYVQKKSQRGTYATVYQDAGCLSGDWESLGPGEQRVHTVQAVDARWSMTARLDKGRKKGPTVKIAAGQCFVIPEGVTYVSLIVGKKR